MRTHYDIQWELVEAAGMLIDDALCDKTSRLNAYRAQLDESKRRFSDSQFRCLKEIGERVGKLRALKAEYDNTNDDAIDDLCDKIEIEETILESQRETLNILFKRRPRNEGRHGASDWRDAVAGS